LEDPWSTFAEDAAGPVPDAFTSNNTNRAWDSGRQQSLAEWKSKADLIQVKKQLWQAVDAEANARKAAVEEAHVD